MAEKEPQKIEETGNLTAEQTTIAEEETTSSSVSAAIPEALLNQDEISSLLDLSTSERQASGALKILIDPGTISYARLPMLEVIFDRLVSLLSATLRNMMSENVKVSLETLTSIRFGDYLSTLSSPVMLSIVRADQWKGSFLVVADTALSYSIVDILLGGSQGDLFQFEEKSFTAIEQNLIERMFELVLQDLVKSFSPLSDVRFHTERIETNSAFAMIVRPASAAIMSRLKIDVDKRGGYLDFVLPYATLEPVREKLLQKFMGEKFGHDSIWEQHLESELWHTEVEIEAILDHISMNLGEVVAWKVGSHIIFKTRPDSDITLKCGESDVLRGRMGQRNGNVAIQIDKIEIGERQSL